MPAGCCFAALETGFCQKSRNRVAEIARGVVTMQHATCNEAVSGSHVSSDVDDVQPAAGLEHAQNFHSCSCFRFFIKVVQHHRRQHAIEFAVGEWQLLRVATLEPNAA